MQLPLTLSLVLALTTFPISTTASSNNASVCYGTPLPPLPPSTATVNRTIPWGTPSFTLPNGTLCCDSLTQVRAGINVINAQLVELLAQRAAYVREATRFKATLDTVDVPARNVEVIEGAVNASRTTNPRLPETIARAVFEAIINASVPFERCVFGEFEEGGCGGE
ncbi:hypothetical protein ONS95_006013 [Cadophora gregata]|uniref:uncharacterized protein n=1 Tax=Cadophora gregata TaxID=51156 RepID=UPI0026DAFFE9|nr:uncharacterized protein ONS95_006013 [Cadophora gregata]KAK0102393.1 hypothetical protein ONS95_006013 [Cadophora gregata]KAK0104017.1 hypothetical protein ONS96_005122 [Cadophora gregata f. sp. sojae]